MNLLYILLLVLWSAFNSSDAWYYYTEMPNTTDQPSQTAQAPSSYPTSAQASISNPTSAQASSSYPTSAFVTPCWWDWYNGPCYWAPTQAPSSYPTSAQAPSRRRPYYQMTTSYWRIQDAPVPSITVFRPMQDREHVIVMCSFGRRFIESSFQLSVEGDHSYTLKIPLFYSDEKRLFDVKVSTPVSFTCVHEINSAVNRHSETYAYSPSGKTYDFHAVLDQHETGVSSFYIGFFSFIVVGLFAMTAAVIMATLKTMSNAKCSVITGEVNDYDDV